MAIGFISKINLKIRNYEVTGDDNCIYNLPFNECGINGFLCGDVIEFEIQPAPAKSYKSFNPVKLYNKYFEELSKKAGTTQEISGYVIEKKKFGFNVSYNGLNCFLPFSETYIENPKLHELNNILNSFQQFRVAEIKNGFIILSRKSFLKAALKNLVETEISNLDIGQTFKGKVTAVVNFGVFITNEYSEGLLHISKIIPVYNTSLPKETKNNLRLILEEIFELGKEIIVSVEEKINGKYYLILNKEKEERLVKSINTTIAKSPFKLNNYF